MTTPVIEVPKCVATWLRTKREYVCSGVYRSRYNGDWLYSVYPPLQRAYHQVIGNERAQHMRIGEITTYLHTARREAAILRRQSR